MIEHELHVRALVYPSDDGSVAKVAVEVRPLPLDESLHNAVAAAMVTAATEVLKLAKVIADDAPPLH